MNNKGGRKDESEMESRRHHDYKNHGNPLPGIPRLDTCRYAGGGQESPVVISALRDAGRETQREHSFPRGRYPRREAGRRHLHWEWSQSGAISHHEQPLHLVPGRPDRGGLPPESIHYVLCTHLHLDHVGWNTRLVNGKWVPTLPKASYLIDK